MRKFLLLFALAQIEAAELLVSNSHDQASNALYDSMHVQPGEQILFQLKHLKHPGTNVFLWHIEGEESVKTSIPEFTWIATDSPGWKRVNVITMNDKSRIDGSHFKLYVGNLETPKIAIQDGAKRPGCPLTLRAHVDSYLGTSVEIQKYLWTIEQSGKRIGAYATSTNVLDFNLPLDHAPLSIKVSAVDTRDNHSPDGILHIDIKPW